jgi:hemerythrin superfamily protein
MTPETISPDEHPVAERLKQDHRKIERLLEEVQITIGEGERARAKESVQALERFLAKHEDGEEKTLLPILRTRAMLTGVLDQLHHEHRVGQVLMRGRKFRGTQPAGWRSRRCGACV